MDAMKSDVCVLIEIAVLQEEIHHCLPYLRRVGRTVLPGRSFCNLVLKWFCWLIFVFSQQASAKIVKENSLSGRGKSSLQELLNKELWPQAREAVFGLFEEYFAMCEEAVGDASRNIKALDALFNLLWESSTRPFALRQILQLMKVASQP